MLLAEGCIMSKRRVPTRVLEMSGAYDKNPSRAKERENEPRPTEPIGSPPSDFLKEHSLEAERLLKAWNDIINMVPEGVLTSADHGHVEMTARVMVRTRLYGAQSSDFALLDKLLGKMGCNPADRSKVAITKKKHEGDQSDWGSIATEARSIRAKKA